VYAPQFQLHPHKKLPDSYGQKRRNITINKARNQRTPVPLPFLIFRKDRKRTYSVPVTRMRNGIVFKTPAPHTTSSASSCCSCQYYLWDAYIPGGGGGAPSLSCQTLRSSQCGQHAQVAHTHSQALPGSDKTQEFWTLPTIYHGLRLLRNCRRLFRLTEVKLSSSFLWGVDLVDTPPLWVAVSQQPFSLRSPLHQTCKPGFL
jgi:hypothetical protein